MELPSGRERSLSTLTHHSRTSTVSNSKSSSRPTFPYMTVIGNMGGGNERGRAAYAYRDLDEELFFPSVEHEYHSQESPLQVSKPLSESVILRSHFDKARAKRRRVLCVVGGGLLLLLGGSALLVLAKYMDTQHQRSPLELTIGAPYGALRGKGDLKPSLSTPVDGELDEHVGNYLDQNGPNVGDVDASDYRFLGDDEPKYPHQQTEQKKTKQKQKTDTKVVEEEEDDESDLYYYGDDAGDRPW